LRAAVGALLVVAAVFVACVVVVVALLAEAWNAADEDLREGEDRCGR